MNRKKSKTKILCLLFVFLFLNGCSLRKDAGLTELYSFEDRSLALLETASLDYAPLFAEDLCVVSAEVPFPTGAVDAVSAALFDLKNETVVYSEAAFEQLSPASITKIMTALIAIKYGNLEDMVTVTEDAVITESGATLCHINPGDVLSMEQLLYGLMLPSGNDAGVAIAVHMAGSVEAFSDMMNEEALRLGATGTHFMNPHGLTQDDHYTTAYDLYLIFNEALKHPEFREVTGTTTYISNYVDSTGAPISKTWDGSNQYMSGRQEIPEGLTVFSGKTGTTKAAGNCLIIATKDEEDNEYISVVLKAESRPALYRNMTNIIRKIVD